MFPFNLKMMWGAPGSAVGCIVWESGPFALKEGGREAAILSCDHIISLPQPRFLVHTFVKLPSLGPTNYRWHMCAIHARFHPLRDFQVTLDVTLDIIGCIQGRRWPIIPGIFAPFAIRIPIGSDGNAQTEVWSDNTSTCIKGSYYLLASTNTKRPLNLAYT